MTFLDYSDNDFNSMQAQAMRRAMQMQERSRQTAEEGEEKSSPPKKEERSVPAAKGSVLSNLKIDEEKALIAMLIYILYKQGADIKLLLGLGYLLI